MLKVNRLGEVVQLIMGREMGGAVLYWTAAYLVGGLLIDTGCAYTAEELAQFLEGEEVKQVVNTHHHEDHVGANSLLQKRFGPKAYAHPLAVPLIAGRLPLREYQEVVWGYPDPAEVEPVPETIGASGHTFEVIETPGHSPDHISLFERKRGWCFTGDLFISEKLKMLRADEDIDGITASLEKLLRLPADELIIYTGAGGVLTEGRKAISAFLEYLQGLRSNVVRLAGQSLGAPEIRDRIFGRETKLEPLTGGHFSILNLIEQLLPKE